MKINLNHIIKVKLTDLGNKTYEDNLLSQYGSLSHFLGLGEIRLKKTEDQDGYIHFQLWEFMSIFGEHFYVGSEAVTEDNAIIVSNDTTIELQEQLRKARKKAKRWKRKYLELRYELNMAESKKKMMKEEMTYAEAKNYLLHCIDEAKSKDWAAGIKFALTIIENAIKSEDNG